MREMNVKNAKVHEKDRCGADLVIIEPCHIRMTHTTASVAGSRQRASTITSTFNAYNIYQLSVCTPNTILALHCVIFEISGYILN